WHIALRGRRHVGHARRLVREAPGRRSRSRTGADAELRRWGALLPVQDLQEFLDPLERLLMPLVGIHYAIAIALQRFRFGLAQPAGKERRRDALRSDVESHDAPTPAIEPEPRRTPPSPLHCCASR